MELIIENIKSQNDQKLIIDLATRLGLKVHTYDAKKRGYRIIESYEKG